VNGRGQVGQLAVDVAVDCRLVRGNLEIAQPEQQNSGGIDRPEKGRLRCIYTGDCAESGNPY